MEHFSTGLLLTSSQVADLLGVHVSSVKRWTNDGDLLATTTSGGHRRIHLHDALTAAKSRGIITYLDPFTPFEGHVWRAVKDAEELGDFRRVLSLAMGWLLREYPQRVGDLFVELGNRGVVPFDIFLDRGVRPFLGKVSDAVEEGRLRPAGERLVSQILLDALFRIRLGVPLRTGSAPTRGAPVAVVGGLEGDLHDLGLVGLRVLLEREGYVVHSLGSDVPAADFPAAQRSHGAILVCIACGTRSAGSNVQEAIQQLAADYDPRSPFALFIAVAEGFQDVQGAGGPFTSLAISDSWEHLGDGVRALNHGSQQGRKASA